VSRVDVRTRIGTAILVVAALSLGRVITDNLPGAGRAERPFMTEVAVGQPAHLRTGDVTVTRVRGGRAVTEIGSTMRSPGVWVVVEYTWTPANASEALGSVAVRAEGGQRWVALSGRNVQSCGASVPGLPVRCTAAVELPAELAPRARLELSPESASTDYDSMASVHLGIDRAAVDAWLASADPIELPQPEVGEA
jgi:hypothetical protein